MKLSVSMNEDLQKDAHYKQHFSKESDSLANKLQVRGGWHHRNEQVNYRGAAYQQN